MLEERARANGPTLSEWVRDVLLSGAAEPGAEAGSEVVLAEVPALRLLFLNHHFHEGREPLTEVELRGLIDRADATKLERARERLQAARAASKEYERSWTAAERLYLSDYLNSGARGKASAMWVSKYTLLKAVVGKGERLVMGEEVERVRGRDCKLAYRSADAAGASVTQRLVVLGSEF